MFEVFHAAMKIEKPRWFKFEYFTGGQSEMTSQASLWNFVRQQIIKAQNFLELSSKFPET